MCLLFLFTVSDHGIPEPLKKGRYPREQIVILEMQLTAPLRNEANDPGALLQLQCLSELDRSLSLTLT